MIQTLSKSFEINVNLGHINVNSIMN